MRIDNAVRFDCYSNNRNECILLGIRDDNDMHFAASLEHSEYRNFASHAVSTFAFPGAAQVAFVAFNLPRKPWLGFGKL